MQNNIIRSGTDNPSVIISGVGRLAISATVLLRDNLDENGSGDRNVKRRPVATS